MMCLVRAVEASWPIISLYLLHFEEVVKVKSVSRSELKRQKHQPFDLDKKGLLKETN